MFPLLPHSRRIARMAYCKNLTPDLMNTTRRAFLSSAAAFFFAPQGPADLTLKIGGVEVPIGPKHTIRTTGYNGSFPGPILRFPEGRSVTVDVINNTASPELVHWHG